MLTTNKIKLESGDTPKKGTIIVPSGQKYRVTEFDPDQPAGRQTKTTLMEPKSREVPDPARFVNVNKRETKKIAGSMLTTANYKDRLEAANPKPEKKVRGRRKKK